LRPCGVVLSSIGAEEDIESSSSIAATGVGADKGIFEVVTCCANPSIKAVAGNNLPQ